MKTRSLIRSDDEEKLYLEIRRSGNPGTVPPVSLSTSETVYMYKVESVDVLFLSSLPSTSVSK